ncbi:hypothetical protein FHG87_025282, partial [Trinorchestia longiramus]
SGGNGKPHYHPTLNQHEWYRPSTAATATSSTTPGSHSSGGDGLDSMGPGGAMASSSGRLEARVGRSRIWKRILDHCFDNSDRRQYGMGLTGRLFGRSFRSMRTRGGLHRQDVSQVKHQLDEMEDYRPYFTWWVSCVQVAVFLLSILCYGIAPYGVSVKQQSGQ